MIITDSIKKVVLDALEHRRGDISENLERARHWFKGDTDAELDRPFDQFGTRRQFLQGCEARMAEVEAAIAWVKSAQDSMGQVLRLLGAAHRLGGFLRNGVCQVAANGPPDAAWRLQAETFAAEWDALEDEIIAVMSRP